MIKNSIVGSRLITFKLSSNTCKMYLTLCSDSSKKYYSDNTVACFTTQLTEPICLGDAQYEVGVMEAFLPPLIPADARNSPIFLYTDVIKPTMVSDTAVRLLRVFTPHNDTGYHECAVVHYLPIERRNFSSITLSFHSRTGERYPFPTGEHSSTVVLHFREERKY